MQNCTHLNLSDDSIVCLATAHAQLSPFSSIGVSSTAERELGTPSERKSHTHVATFLFCAVAAHRRTGGKGSRGGIHLSDTYDILHMSYGKCNSQFGHVKTPFVNISLTNAHMLLTVLS